MTDLFTFLVRDLDRHRVAGLVGHFLTVRDRDLLAVLLGDLNMNFELWEASTYNRIISITDGSCWRILYDCLSSV